MCITRCFALLCLLACSKLGKSNVLMSKIKPLSSRYYFSLTRQVAAPPRKHCAGRLKYYLLRKLISKRSLAGRSKYAMPTIATQ